ncbi:hypothetical protein MRB53_000576 [Persea americana]|uniref:Uncharacterized protein n=1 Tax=Persea americana TaxID=3435 RepID=A0ACC2MPX2_PERAE|nr:hypothetical protein MRB53_000576 [Persea americana]
MVEDLSKNGKLRNMLSICTPIWRKKQKKVSIALGLLTSELSEEPWRGNVINFSVNPQLHIIEWKTLQEKVEFIEDMEFDYEIDFLKVFNRILDVAVAAKLEEEKLVKRMFVFCCFDFNDGRKIRGMRIMLPSRISTRSRVMGHLCRTLCFGI